MLRAYRMMLDFFGIEPKNEITGKLQRGNNWRERMAHLNRFTSELSLLLLAHHCMLTIQGLKKTFFYVPMDELSGEGRLAQ